MIRLHRCLPLAGALALALLLPVGCSGTSSPSKEVIGDVYVGGFTTKPNGNRVATVWVNGNPAPLTDGTTDAWVQSVAISGQNVYAFGGDHAGPGGALLPTVWMTNQPPDQPLTQPFAGADFQTTHYGDGGLDTSPFLCGTVSGGTPYLAGAQTAVGQPGNTLTIWTSGQAQAYPGASPSLIGNPTGIAATQAGTGTDVYVAGSTTDTSVANSPNTAVYWKNGTPMPLTDGSQDAMANGLTIFNGQVLVVGQIGASPTQATLWMADGTSAVLPAQWQLAAIANGVAVGNAGIFVGGTDTMGTMTVAKVWQGDGASFNGTNLSDGSNNAAVLGLAVSGATVHAAGYEQRNGISVAKIWNGRLATALSDGTSAAAATSVAVMVR